MKLEKYMIEYEIETSNESECNKIMNQAEYRSKNMEQAINYIKYACWNMREAVGPDSDTFKKLKRVYLNMIDESYALQEKVRKEMDRKISMD